MMGACKKCCNIMAWLFLVAGVLFLLVDLGFWTFWNIQWWTVVLILMGVCCMGKAKCKDCK